jgi:hypothetical protein
MSSSFGGISVTLDGDIGLGRNSRPIRRGQNDGQVWRRQNIDHHELRPGDKSSRPAGCKPTRGWNPRDQWVISPPGAHPALVNEDTFLRAQQISALPTRTTRTPTATSSPVW